MRKERMEKEARIEKGKIKSKQIKEREEKRKIQSMITDMLIKLPENERKLCKRREEKERLLLLQDTKQELWKIILDDKENEKEKLTKH